MLFAFRGVRTTGARFLVVAVDVDVGLGVGDLLTFGLGVGFATFEVLEVGPLPLRPSIMMCPSWT